MDRAGRGMQWIRKEWTLEEECEGMSMVVQWLRIHLATQGIRV